MIYQKWWKILGILLLIYTLLAGMLVPLKPGIEKVEPARATAGDTLHMQIWGYNTHWNKDNLRLWLKFDEQYALSGRITSAEDRKIHAEFNVPPTLPGNDPVIPLSLIIDDPGTGPAVLPSAVFLKRGKGDNMQLSTDWSADPVTNLHFREDFTYPYRNLLAETIRNQYYHVPLWFAMIIIFIFSVIKSIQNLQNFNNRRECEIEALNWTGILFGLMGLVTGMIWAKYTWGKFWNWDIKQTTALVAVLIYLAYFILRGSVTDRRVQARVGNVYNIFAFVMLIPLLFVIPRMADSLHPGAGGNPAFGGDDLDNTMRAVFYPAVIGWSLMGMWIASLKARTLVLWRERLEQLANI